MSNGDSGVSDAGLPPVVPDPPARIVGYGVDTLLLNVRYADTNGKPIKQELDEQYVTVLNEWQEKAKVAEEPVVIPLAFRAVTVTRSVCPLRECRSWPVCPAGHRACAVHPVRRLDDVDAGKRGRNRFSLSPTRRGSGCRGEGLSEPGVWRQDCQYRGLRGSDHASCLGALGN